MLKLKLKTKPDDGLPTISFGIQAVGAGLVPARLPIQCLLKNHNRPLMLVAALPAVDVTGRQNRVEPDLTR